MNSIINESTLLPVSLVVLIMGGVASWAKVFFDVRSLKKELDEMKAQMSSEAIKRDDHSNRLTRIEEQTKGLSQKIEDLGKAVAEKLDDLRDFIRPARSKRG